MKKTRRRRRNKTSIDLPLCQGSRQVATRLETSLIQCQDPHDSSTSCMHKPSRILLRTTRVTFSFTVCKVHLINRSSRISRQTTIDLFPLYLRGSFETFLRLSGAYQLECGRSSRHTAGRVKTGNMAQDAEMI